MDEVLRNNDQVAEYENEIQELRWQIQKLQEAGNLMDYTGKNQVPRSIFCYHEKVLCSFSWGHFFANITQFLLWKYSP